MKEKDLIVKADTLTKRDTVVSIMIIGFLFFTFGFVSWINAILIPFFKIACELDHFESYFVTFAFYISYLIFSVPSAYLLKKSGFKNGIMIGFWIIALGAFIFIPAALSRTYYLFLLGLFIIGAGLALLQTTANPYITILGPKERAAQRISIMGICNKGAGILAPLILASLILRATDSSLFAQIPVMPAAEKSAALDELIRRVIPPYTFLGIFLFIMGILIRKSPLPDIDTEHESEGVAKANVDKKNIFQFPHLVLGAIAIFLHVGTQVISIDTIIGYAGSMNIDLLEARVFPSYTLTVTIAGYILGIICIPRFISQTNALKACTFLGFILVMLILFTRGQVALLGHKADISIWFLVLLGLPNSLTWAGIWPLALDGLGRFTKLGASLLIMGLCGNAILPSVYGYFADKIGVHYAYWVLLPCYLYLIYYAFYGHKVKRWKI
ncbi:MAG: sugar MFS transporter [Sphingobacteriales bacterium]|nr:sugar MFS transporter [Sphingobacteriales bacterium]OJY90173.1 MAG: glucose/galactose MFS transporter [Sphingobacteriales bacterium 44-15]